jgi:anti-sigma factor RsiW
MNAKFDRHYPDGSWEEYALGMLSDEDSKSLEEHLLICSACQDLLAEVDEYIRVVKTALVSWEPSNEPSFVTDFAEWRCRR